MIIFELYQPNIIQFKIFIISLKFLSTMMKFKLLDSRILHKSVMTTMFAFRILIKTLNKPKFLPTI